MAVASIQPNPLADSSTVSESGALRAFYDAAVPGHRLQLFAASCTPWRRGREASQGRFNALTFSPDQPDELRLWPSRMLKFTQLQTHFSFEAGIFG